MQIHKKQKEESTIKLVGTWAIHPFVHFHVSPNPT